VYYARIIGQADVKPVSNVFTFQRLARPTPDPDDFAAATLLAATLAAQWPTLATELLHTVYTGNEVSVYALNSPLMPAVTHALVAPGGRPADQHFLQVAGLIRHTVFRRGRGSTGHTYLSPVASTDVTVNGDQMKDFWVANANTDFHAMITNTLNAMNSAFPGPWTYVQLSKQTFGGVYGKIFEITNSEAVVPASSQKRRLGR
jgi:hypothetical protein